MHKSTGCGRPSTRWRGGDFAIRQTALVDSSCRAGCFLKGARLPDDRPKWHPLLACEEYQPGRWVMLDQYRQPYALIDILRFQGDVRYRVTTWEQESTARRLLGYFTTLREAASNGHQTWIMSLSPSAMGVPDKHLRGRGLANTPARTERD